MYDLYDSWTSILPLSHTISHFSNALLLDFCLYFCSKTGALLQIPYSLDFDSLLMSRVSFLPGLGPAPWGPSIADWGSIVHGTRVLQLTVIMTLSLQIGLSIVGACTTMPDFPLLLITWLPLSV